MATMKSLESLPEDVSYTIRMADLMRIRKLLAEIRVPATIYDKDPLRMANRVIENSAAAAEEISKLLPEV